jgi:Leucine-rich repeat (LRR) protein
VDFAETSVTLPNYYSHQTPKESNIQNLTNLCISQNIISMIKSVRMGEMKNAYKVSVGNPEGKILLEYESIDSSLILKWILMSSLVWVVTERMLVVVYRRFGTTSQSPFQGSISLIF